MLEFLNDNIFVMFGGILVYSNCSPLLRLVPLFV